MNERGDMRKASNCALLDSLSPEWGEGRGRPLSMESGHRQYFEHFSPRSRDTSPRLLSTFMIVSDLQRP